MNLNGEYMFKGNNIESLLTNFSSHDNAIYNSKSISKIDLPLNLAYIGELPTGAGTIISLSLLSIYLLRRYKNKST
ncbi:hypothetical protein J4408_02990 [Candidatus Pacearchaeota archaeon]|nr:hypothetical protein [Candidatus Pacearchaeota archaeon]